MISKTAEYGLRAVTCLAAEAGTALSADLLAERTKVPRRYLTRVLQDLVAAGVVTSRSGPRGGYLLADGTIDRSILDVLAAVAPIERITSCPLGIGAHKSLCPLHRELDRAYAATEAALAAVTIRQLVTSTDPITPLCAPGRRKKSTVARGKTG